MENREQAKRNTVGTLYSPTVSTIRNAKGFTYVELLVTFSLTILLFASTLVLSGQMFEQGERNADQLVLQREASALQFLMLSEMKQGYDFHVSGHDLFFQLDSSQTVKLQYRDAKLERLVNKQGSSGQYSGNIILSRYVDHVSFAPDADAQGVEIRLVFKKGDATLTQRTYWRSRIEQEEG